MKRASLLLLTLLAGCTMAPPTGGGTPTPSAAVKTPSGAQLPSCKLPVASALLDAGRVFTGTISFPEGTLTESGTGTLDPKLLHGWHAPAFDRAVSRWVPVPPAAIAPDGLRYAYAETRWVQGGPVPTVTHVHVVDVATGRDRDVYSQNAFEVAAFAVDGIYVVQHFPQADGSAGLWLIDPDAGTVRPVSPDKKQWAVMGGAAWAGELVPGDPPTQSKFQADRLLRLDLRTGQIAPWFYRKGQQVQVLGVDGDGHPIAQVGTGTRTELWLVGAPDEGRQLYVGEGWNVPGAVLFDSPAHTDRHGVWLPSDHGLFLYTPAAGLQKVFQGGPRFLYPAGPCA